MMSTVYATQRDLEWVRHCKVWRLLRGCSLYFGERNLSESITVLDTLKWGGRLLELKIQWFCTSVVETLKSLHTPSKDIEYSEKPWILQLETALIDLLGPSRLATTPLLDTILSNWRR